MENHCFPREILIYKWWMFHVYINELVGKLNSKICCMSSLVTLAESPRLGRFDMFRQAMKEMNFKLIANFFLTTFPTNMSLGNAG